MAYNFVTKEHKPIVITMYIGKLRNNCWQHYPFVWLCKIIRTYVNCFF